MANMKVVAASSNSALQKFLRENLDVAGYRVIGTEQTGEGLLEMISEEMPDLVMVDIMMPNLDGIEICLRIRQWSQVPVMLLSTWGVVPGKVRGLNLGAASYLTEPFGGDEFMARIREMLQRNIFAEYSRANRPPFSSKSATPGARGIAAVGNQSCLS